MQPQEQLTKQREKKLEELKKLGINPFPSSFKKSHNASEILNEFKTLNKEEKTNKVISIAGRLITSRPMGKITFAHMKDFSGSIQIYFNEPNSKENYNLLKNYIDLGDIIGVEGTVFKTKTGEITVDVKKLTLLSKSLLPLPDKWHGLKDTEIRYRQRYVDLIVNDEVKEVFLKRSKIIASIREFLTLNSFIEVETPIIQPIYGGTNARPFESTLNALNMKVYMRISNELYLKRLLVGGYEKIFEFSPDFRNEGIDRTHNPEFLQMETMWTFADYKANMDLCEEMIEYVAKKVLGTTKIKFQGKEIDVKRPWKRFTMQEAIKKYLKLDIDSLDDKDLKALLKNHNLKLEQEFSRGAAIELIFSELIEKNLIEPTLIYDYPSETSVLAKTKDKNPKIAERFEPYILGMEIGNSYSELNNPKILLENWKKQEQLSLKGDQEAQKIDKDFIRALSYGMPPASGLGIGINKLIISTIVV